jgi:hypothetical protein
MRNVTKIVIGIIFILSASYLFYKIEYGFGVLLLFGLLVLFKIDGLTNLALNLKNGQFNANFQNSNEKTIEEKARKLDNEILENKLPITKNNYIRFQNIEAKILAEQQKKYGTEMKTLVHFMYGQPDKPEFIYTPDGSLQTNDALYFFEVKYILKPEFTKNIVEQTTKYLKTVYDKFSLNMGSDKKLIIKLLLASGQDIDTSKYILPTGIELEFIKI